MKHIVEQLVADALANLPDLAEAAADLNVADAVERTRDPSHGDFASNVAMRLAKPARRNPRELATMVIEALPESDAIEKVDIAGPGFINFTLSANAFHAEIESILDKGTDYGRRPRKDGPNILLEFVSANPTGPLHVGHGRHAAYGATVGNLLEAAGYPVTREYYVNDAGRQMDILGASVWLRWLEANGTEVAFPLAGYRGDYIRDIAAEIDTAGIGVNPADEVCDGLPDDGPADSEKDTADERAANKTAREAYVGALVDRAQALLGADGFDRIRQQSLESIRDDIKDDLEEFGVTFDNWFSEQSLTKTGRIDDALDVLRERGMLYEKDGAWWFPSTQFGDEKDRVVVRDNGVKTYFASDIAYHFDKRERGFDHLIDILGADHHGYVSRVRGGLEAMGYAGDDLEVELVQFVSLFRSGEKVQMSTRSGKFDTLRELRAEVGNNAARFYYVMRSNDQHLDFDLDVAKTQTKDNPVYYLQYAHARVAGIFRKAQELGIDIDQQNGRGKLDLLVLPAEKAIMTAVSRYPEIVELAAQNRAPQTLLHYLRDLVGDFSTWYQSHKFLEDADDLRDARVVLSVAVRTIIANGLGILGVSAPDSM